MSSMTEAQHYTFNIGIQRRQKFWNDRLKPWQSKWWVQNDTSELLTVSLHIKICLVVCMWKSKMTSIQALFSVVQNHIFVTAEAAGQTPYDIDGSTESTHDVHRSLLMMLALRCLHARTTVVTHVISLAVLTFDLTWPIVTVQFVSFQWSVVRRCCCSDDITT